MQFFAALMGVSFRGAEIQELVKTLEVGTELSLERDPENQYDANAIKVIYADNENGEDVFIGFVAKEVAEELAPLLDGGYTATAKVIDFLSPVKPHLEIEATLTDEGADEEGKDEEDLGEDTEDDV